MVSFHFWVSKNRQGIIVADGESETLGKFMHNNNIELNNEASIKKIWAKDKEEAKKIYRKEYNH